MKKLLTCALILMVASVCFGRTPVNTDIAGWSNYDSDKGIAIDADGHLIPMTDDNHDLGTSTYQFNDLYIDGVANIDDLQADAATITDPIISNLVMKYDTWVDLAVKSSISVCNIAITTATLDGATSAQLVSAHTQMGGGVVPRNIAVSVDFYQEHVSTSWIRLSCVLAGYDARGNAISETVLSSQAVHYSLNAFSYVETSTWEFLATAGDWGVAGLGANYVTVNLNLGTGDKIALLGNINGTTRGTDIMWATVDAADEFGSFTFNATYDTWTHSDVPDGSDDFGLGYLVDSK